MCSLVPIERASLSSYVLLCQRILENCSCARLPRAKLDSFIKFDASYFITICFFPWDLSSISVSQPVILRFSEK